MNYSQLPLPLGDVLYIAELPASIAPSLSTYHSLTQQLLDEIAPRESVWQLTHLPSGAPRLVSPDRDYHISVSHSGSYVALVLSEGAHGVGIDIQVASNKLPQVAPRFMSLTELVYYRDLTTSEANEWSYTVWCLKEAAYEAYPLQVKRHLATNYTVSPPEASLSCDVESNSFARYTVYADEGDDHPTLLTGCLLHSIMTAPYHLTYVQVMTGAFES